MYGLLSIDVCSASNERVATGHLNVIATESFVSTLAELGRHTLYVLVVILADVSASVCSARWGSISPLRVNIDTLVTSRSPRSGPRCVR